MTAVECPPGARPSVLPVAAMVATGALLAPLNSTMIAVALPEIRTDFELSHGAVGWLVATYLIAMAVIQPIAGRLGDEVGRLRVFRLGLVAFLACSLAAVAAPNFPLLVIFRTLQAVAGSILIPNGIGMLRSVVPAERFGTFNGINSAVIGSTAAAGPLLGAAILAFAPWRALFLANVPVVVVALALTARVQGPDRQEQRPGFQVDVAGLVLFAVLLGLGSWLLSALGSQRMAVPLALTLVAALLFVRQERGRHAPVAAWPLFRIPAFVGASSHILLMNLAMYTTLLAVPFFITEVQLKSSAVAGLLLGAMAALQAVAAPVAGRVSDAVGRRKPTVASSLIALLAAVMLLSGLSASTPTWYLAACVTVLGLGVGVGFVTASTAAVESVPEALSGSAAGTQSMMRYVGSIIGAGVLGGLLGTEGGTGGTDIAPYRVMFGVVACMTGLSLVAAWMIRPRRDGNGRA